jgi:hypothetical protein
MSSNWRPFLAVAAAIVLGWFVAMQSTSSGQNPARVVPVRWQYKVAISGVFDENTANNLGSEGWELVTIYEQDKGQLRAIFKRRS